MAKKTYRINRDEVSVKAANTVYNGRISSEDNAQDAIDNLDARVSTLEQGGSSGGGGGSIVASNPYSGKLFAFIGDSFTSPGKWQSRMCNVLGAINGYNAGKDESRFCRYISGFMRTGYAQAVAIVNYYKDRDVKPDYIMIMLGTNDAGSIQANSSILGEIDYGKVYYNTINDVSGEYDNIGFYKYGENHIDTENPFWKYERATTYSGNQNSGNVKGCIRQYLVNPAEWIYDAECDTSIAATAPSSPMTDKLDLRYTVGGMQATIAYLRYHLPNAIIKIGFTPMGLMHAVPNGRTSQTNLICEKMKEVAEIYGIDYLETRHCGFSFIVERDIECNGSGGHPSETGHQRIGDYIANLLLGGRGSEF